MASTNTGAARALEACRASFSPESVSGGDAAPDRLTRSTASRTHKPAGALLIRRREDLVKAIEIANSSRAALHPISGGKNWGYGDATPPGPDQIVLDLSAMNRIGNVDEDAASVVIEPGVTQGQLADYLARNHPGLMLDCTGAGPHATIVGNAMERGVGQFFPSRFADMVLELWGVWGDGETFHIDVAALAPDAAAALPQSNAFVATRAKIRLVRRAPHFEFFAASVDRHDDVARLADAVAALRRDIAEASQGKPGAVSISGIKIANDLRLISAEQASPDPNARLSDAQRLDLRGAALTGAWSLSFGLHGERADVERWKEAFAAVMSDVGARAGFYTEGRMRLLNAAASASVISPFYKERLAALRVRAANGRAALDLHLGRPRSEFLRGAYWLAGGGGEATDALDPARDGCGLYWLPLMVPAQGPRLADLLDRVMAPIFERYGFDFFVTVSFGDDRHFVVVANMIFDRRNPDACARAERCYADVLQAGLENGCPPYRVIAALLDGGLSDALPRSTEAAKTKSRRDPNGVISPGRMIPDWTAVVG